MDLSVATIKDSGIMENRHRSEALLRVFAVVTILLAILPSCMVSAATAPADYLVPPPPPPAFSPARPPNLLASESRPVPAHYIGSSDRAAQRPAREPGLMGRVARWFGFDANNFAFDQQPSEAATGNQLYYYPNPQRHAGGSKEPCNLCNKYPWVPMMLNSVYHSAPGAWDQPKQIQPPKNAPSYVQKNLGFPAATHLQGAASSLKQRAVQFQFPALGSHKGQTNGGDQSLHFSSGPFLPLPIPNSDSTALPSIHRAAPFRAASKLPLPPAAAAAPLQPTTQAPYFTENIASAHSEIHTDTIVPTQIPPSTPIKDASFEIVKSHQLADYVTSVEYPIAYVPAHAYDVHSGNSPLSSAAGLTVNAGRYQHSTLSPTLSQHIPGSQLLTEPGSFVVGDLQPQQQLQSSVYEADSTPVGNTQSSALDNYASASNYNASVMEHHSLASGKFDSWSVESNQFLYHTTTTEVPATPTTSETSTPPTIDTDINSEQGLTNEVEFVASIQTSKDNTQRVPTTSTGAHKSRQRDTPKRLLDAPIQHLGGNLGLPRPFTRDPSDLGLRLAAKDQHFPAEKLANAVAAAPTPTSTYSSVDASGQHAGMSPPPAPSIVTPDRQPQLRPFITKVQPRPFESTRHTTATQTTTSIQYQPGNAGNLEWHMPEESVVFPVEATTHIAPQTSSKPRATKYLTKILASNLRELLQREHTPSPKIRLSPNALSIDLRALQKNIDDWTEQEYTSLSHRPSTPTILGKSKHIPKEYLPSTTVSTAPDPSTARQPKTTKSFTHSGELPVSINSLEPLYDRGATKKLQYTSIHSNHIQDSVERSSAGAARNKSTTAQPVATSSTTTARPLDFVEMGIQESELQWQKAQVSISPQTREKVYVVTPQPRFIPQSPAASSTISDAPLDSHSSGSKKPRFLIRPTPGNVTASNLLHLLATPERSRHTSDTLRGYFGSDSLVPQLFGLEGLSAYVPAQPVEIIDGNSKVLTSVTPPSNAATTAAQNIMDLTRDRHVAPQRRTIVAPSPR